jgi:hypothetical protein
VTELERLRRIEAAARRYRALELGTIDAEEAYEDAQTAAVADYANFGVDNGDRVERRRRMVDVAKGARDAARGELDAALDACARASPIRLY